MWLTARRRTTVPPLVYAMEAGVNPGYRGEVNRRFRLLSDAEQDPAALPGNRSTLLPEPFVATDWDESPDGRRVEPKDLIDT